MTKNIFVFILLLITLSIRVTAQERFTISGSVSSKSSGETLIGTTISVEKGSASIATNEYGFFSITLNKGVYVLSITTSGYELLTDTIELNKNIVKKYSLTEQVKSLEEVKVSTNTKGRSISGTQMGIERLTMTEIKSIPMLFGERDILKAIQLLPGIKSAGDGNSGFYVRGGGTDQNLILLDEATVYNASHLLGFFSTFNPDVIKDVTVYKGGMPAQYGGRLSSVLDIKMNEGNNQHYDVSGGVGLISTKLNVEGPIKKDISSFLFSGRRTYADVFVGLSNDSNINRNKLYFYDFNAKINYKLGEKDKLYLSGYFGRDFLKLDKQFNLNWGNITGTLRWNHIISEKVFSNTSFIYSNYDYAININNVNNDVKISSQIKDLNLKQEFQWYANSKHSLRFGFNTTYHNMKPGEVTSSGKTSFNDFFLQNRYSWDNNVFVSDNWKLNKRVNMSLGLRVSSFSIFGPGDFYNVNSAGIVTDTLNYKKGELVKNYLRLEPRIAASFIMNESTSLKAAYVRNVQNLHLIANSASNAPTDKWIASTNIIKPELSDQFSIGWYKNLANNQYELTVESYYKSMSNQIDYRTGADVFTNDAIESQLLVGVGRAYGIEFMIKKNSGRLTGWVNYTLSKTERKINGINENAWYNARQDRTHDVNIVANYQVNKKWNVSANWVFYTGDAVTFPTGKYVMDNQIVFYYTKRNAYRMPNYHRLDIGATMQLRKKKWKSSELAFGIYNAYGRENAYTISFRQSKDDPSRTEAVQTSLFKYIPYITYNFRF